VLVVVLLLDVVAELVVLPVGDCAEPVVEFEPVVEPVPFAFVVLVEELADGEVLAVLPGKGSQGMVPFGVVD
jgi:hypothetical protein